MARQNLAAKVDGEELVVTWQGETRRFPIRWRSGDKVYSGAVFGGRFPQGAKVWPLGVILWPETGEVALDGGFGCNGRSIRTPMCWWADSAQGARSQSNACRRL